MGYFKINKTGMNERKGLLEVRYGCYLSRTDEGNKLKAIDNRMAELEAAELHLHELAGQYSIRG